MLSDKTVLFFLRTLDLVVAGIKMAPELYAAYSESRAKLEQMVKEGRDPTDAELEFLETHIRLLRQELHGDAS